MYETIVLIFLFHMLAAGIYGMAVKVYVASFLLVSESTESPKLGTRIFYKYFRFWSNYMMSFFITPVIVIKPIFGSFETLADRQEVRAILIAIMCLPMALLFSWLEKKFSRWADGRKRRGINAFNKKFGPRRRD